MVILSFQKLRVWQKAHHLSLRAYRLSATFPQIEKFGLADQLRRSASSVASNIAEGHGRQTTKEMIHYLYVARGSVTETQNHALLAHDLGYVVADAIAPLLSEYENLLKGINAMISALKNRQAHARPIFKI